MLGLGPIAGQALDAFGFFTVSIAGTAAANANATGAIGAPSNIAITQPVAALVSTSNATSYATGAFTPAANAKLVVLVFATDTSAPAPTMSGGSLNWNLLTSVAYGSSAQHTGYLFVADVGASPVSTTPTFDCTGFAASGCIACVLQVTGRRASNPILQFSASSGSGSNPTLTPLLATDYRSGYIAGFGTDIGAPGATPPTAWTETVDSGYATPTAGASAAYRAAGDMGAPIAFTAPAGNWGMLFVEVADLAALGGVAAAVGGATGLAGAIAPIAATVAAQGGATGALGGAEPASGTAAGAGASSGALTGSGALTVTAAGTGTASGALAGSKGVISGTAAAAGGASATLTLSGTAAAIGGATGGVAGTGALAGSAAATGGATASGLAVAQAAGTAAATAGASAAASGAGAIAGTAAATSGATGTLTLVGKAAAVGAATGDLRGAGGLGGVDAGTGAALATPTISGTAAAVGGASGSMGSPGSAVGTAAAIGGAAGSPTGTFAATAQADGAGAATGDLSGDGELDARADATGGASADVVGIGDVAGQADAVGAALGDARDVSAGASGAIDGTARAATTAVATLFNRTIAEDYKVDDFVYSALVVSGTEVERMQVGETCVAVRRFKGLQIATLPSKVYVLSDPATISVTVTDPRGATTFYSYPSSITRSSIGIYAVQFDLTIAGTWKIFWNAIGAAKGTGTTTVYAAAA